MFDVTSAFVDSFALFRTLLWKRRYQNRWCCVCHDTTNENLLRNRAGVANNSQHVCLLCHATAFGECVRLGLCNADARRKMNALAQRFDYRIGGGGRFRDHRTQNSCGRRCLYSGNPRGELVSDHRYRGR
jgi:hypothetical protein